MIPSPYDSNKDPYADDKEWKIRAATLADKAFMYIAEEPHGLYVQVNVALPLYRAEKPGVERIKALTSIPGGLTDEDRGWLVSTHKDIWTSFLKRLEDRQLGNIRSCPTVSEWRTHLNSGRRDSELEKHLSNCTHDCPEFVYLLEFEKKKETGAEAPTKAKVLG